MLLDIDHFKAINDNYGHPGGDRILCQLAERLQQVVRPGDVLARYGGEGFAVLAPGVGGGQLTELAERVRQAIAEHPMRPNQAGSVGITVSVGAASPPRIHAGCIPWLSFGHPQATPPVAGRATVSLGLVRLSLGRIRG